MKVQCHKYVGAHGKVHQVCLETDGPDVVGVFDCIKVGRKWVCHQVAPRTWNSKVPGGLKDALLEARLRKTPGRKKDDMS